MLRSKYRWADGRYDRLPTLAAELVSRRVNAIFATDNASARTAKQSSSTIPIVVSVGADPVKLGLVASIARPGGNVTGVSFLSTNTQAIRLQMLHEAVPRAIVSAR
jgi:putative tryptophan/tyrosine transport system substrate-binding protein